MISEAFLTRDYAIDAAAPLSEDDVETYLAVLVRLASLDGFDVAEESFIHRVAASLGLNADEEARNAHKIAMTPSLSTSELVGRVHDGGLRLCLLRDAYRLAAADGSVSDSEIRELGVIAKALGISHASAAAVKAIALQEVRLHREFAQMVKLVRT